MLLVLDLIYYILTILQWIIIIQAVMSWLIAFNVINTYNEAVRSIWLALQKITDPLYRPIRAILPDFGALDFSPFVVLLIVIFLKDHALPYLAPAVM